MNMTMFLLVSAATLLVTLDAVCPARLRRSNVNLKLNLNDLIHEVEKYNETVNESFFVEDVEHLVEAGCKGVFFCKVHQILKHEKWSDHKIARHLQVYINSLHVNCTELLKNVTDSGIKRPLTDLLKHLSTCCRRVNWSA